MTYPPVDPNYPPVGTAYPPVDPNYPPVGAAYPPVEPMMGYPQAVRPEHPQATTVLVLALVGLLCWITAPIAWVIGNKAKKECDAGMYAESGSLTGGRIFAMIWTILGIAGIAITIILTVLFVVLAAASGGF
ncbi:MAG: hypothetical protein LBE83_04175 [Propionibacteriaceae bacterium]|jgi:hypothetical protein|nr:hypothetical protein [Propionibacteriaceae bacterium]